MQQFDHTLYEILSTVVGPRSLSSTVRSDLETRELNDTTRAAALGLGVDNITNVIEQRLQLLVDIYPDFIDFCRCQLQCETPLLIPLWTVWLPLAAWIAQQHQQLSRPLVQGILGGQGTGKTTLVKLLSLILAHLGYSAVGLSLDDLYKTYAERQTLRSQDSRFVWRGPPGTHDLELGLQVLTQFQLRPLNHPLILPRFDKTAHGGIGDRTHSDPVAHADILLFEGWFVGVQPVVDDQAFETAPFPIVNSADRAFARDVNAKLQGYLPLWEHLDRLVILYPLDYRWSKTWRQQAEERAIATSHAGMNNDEIGQFVNYFWKALHPELFITPLVEGYGSADLVIEIQANHQPTQIYSPRNLQQSRSSEVFR
jgi:D-glycerate 3-kinase